MASPASAISNLAWAMLPRLLGASKNTQSLFFSPLSIVVALSLLTGAAEDDTKKKLLEKLGVHRDEELQSISSLINSSGSSMTSSVSVANAIFADKSFTVFDDYKTFLEGFHAEFIQYSNLAEEVDGINSWISDKTEGLIQNMLSKSLLRNSHTVIVNALAFKGSWENKFDERYTQSVAFHLSKEERRSVRMMYLQNTKIWCRLTPTYDAVRLPCGTSETSNNGISLVAYLPKAESSFEEVIDTIKVEGVKPLDDVFSKSKYNQFGFPRFEILGDYTLKASLRELGFPVDQAFPHMGTGDCFVEEVVHKAFVKVDEKGTTAAAATAVMMKRSRPQNQTILIFDRPFIFSIMANDSGTIIFTGIYYGD